MSLALVTKLNDIDLGQAVQTEVSVSDGLSLGDGVPSGGVPGTEPDLFDIIFDDYADTAAFIADKGIRGSAATFVESEDHSTDLMAIVTDVVDSGYGRSKSLRYHYNHGANGCTSITCRRGAQFASRQEAWGEWRVKWSANFTTREDSCIPNDHKFIIGDTTSDESGRWDLRIGSDSYAAHGIGVTRCINPDSEEMEEYINLNSDPQIWAEDLWESDTWHTIRIYIRNSTTVSSRDGFHKVWIDGTLKHSKTNFNTCKADLTTPETIWGFSFNHNKDDGPANTDMYVYWGHAKAWGTDPGW